MNVLGRYYWLKCLEMLADSLNLKPLSAQEPSKSTPGFEPRPRWWDASVLTTAPPLLPTSQSLITFSHGSPPPPHPSVILFTFCKVLGPGY